MVEWIRYEVSMWRIAILKMVPGRIGCVLRNLLLPYRHGRNVTIWDQVHIDAPRNVSFGDNVSVNRYSVLHGGGGIRIGSNVQIGPRATIYSQNHRYADPSLPIDRQGYDLRPVEIGSDVWLAANVTVLPGVTIGDRVVIGAGSVVTQDVPARTLAAGVPARVIKSLP